jgi:hypothetical protein
VVTATEVAWAEVVGLGSPRVVVVVVVVVVAVATC